MNKRKSSQCGRRVGRDGPYKEITMKVLMLGGSHKKFGWNKQDVLQLRLIGVDSNIIHTSLSMVDQLSIFVYIC